MGKKTKTIPKNRKMETECDYLHSRIKLVLPYIYSAIALALWNVLDETEEEKVKDIATLIQESQEIWEKCANEGISVVKLCEEITGFDIQNGI